MTTPSISQRLHVRTVSRSSPIPSKTLEITKHPLNTLHPTAPTPALRTDLNPSANLAHMPLCRHPHLAAYAHLRARPPQRRRSHVPARMGVCGDITHPSFGLSLRLKFQHYNRRTGCTHPRQTVSIGLEPLDRFENRLSEAG